MDKGQLFTYSMTALGAIGGLFSPFIALCVYVSFAIIVPEYMWQWSFPGGGGRFSFIVALSMLTGWVLHGLGRWNFGKGGLVFGSLLAYWVWMFVSMLQADDTEKAWGLCYFYLKLLVPIFVGLTIVDSVEKLKALGWVILLSMGYLAFELNLYYFSDGINVVWLSGFGWMDNNCVSIEMVTGIGLAFFLGLGSRHWWQSGIALFCAALMAHVIMMAHSRGGMLALGFTGIACFILLPKKPQHYLLFLVAGIALLVMAGPSVRKRFATMFEKNNSGNFEASAQSRLDLWAGAGQEAMMNPVLGLGGDNWGRVAPKYGFPEGKEVHSLWVQNAAEVGFPGLFFLMCYFITCMVRLWPLARGTLPVKHPWIRDAARMVIAALTGFMVSAQFVTIKYLEAPFYVCLLGACALAINEGATEPRPLHPQQPLLPVPRVRPQRKQNAAVTHEPLP